MALFNFLKKKKEDDFGDLGGDFGPEPAFPGAGGMPGMPESRAMQPGAVPPGPATGRQDLFTNEPQMPQPMTPTPMQFQPQQPQMQQQGFGGDMRAVTDIFRSQIDVVVSRLDSLKASVDRVNDRMEYIERYLVGRR